MKKDPSDYELFTGGNSKTALFAIYFNIAYKNIEEQVKKQPRDYNHLAEFLWKAHKNARNSSGYKLLDNDKKIIDGLLKKLNEIRNYHSHIWHDNKVLQFENYLSDFIDKKHKEAFAMLTEEDPKGVIAYEERNAKSKYKVELFKKQNGQLYITKEGKVFFLSFFLTTGQMNNFLQLNPGTKRTDGKEYLITRRINTYYCHRDGSSVRGFHHQKTQLEQLQEKQRQEVLQARQAYKLISYLYDYPEYLTNTEKVALYVTENGSTVKVTTVQHLRKIISENQLLQGFNFSFIPYSNTDAHSRDEHDKNRSIAFTHPTVEDYTFHISFDNLYKLIMLSLRYGTASVSRLEKNLQVLVERRRKLYSIICKEVDSYSDDDHDFLTDFENRYLRGYRTLTEMGIEFFDAYDNKRDVVTKKARKLADMIRPNGTVPKQTDSGCEINEPAPIIVHSHDLVEEHDQKFRAGNRFVFYSAKYLIDFGITQDWYFEMETFNEGHKKKVFSKNIPDNFRISIENDHITIGIPKDIARIKQLELDGIFIDAQLASQNSESDIVYALRRHELFYRFCIGPRALKYLMTFLLSDNGDSGRIKGFTSLLLNDYKKLLTDNKESLKLLENKFLPAFMLEGKQTDVFNLILKRIQHIKNELKLSARRKQFLRRDEKNRIIMDCYRLLYDWTDARGNIKFLRKEEYKHLSICHYSLGATDAKGKPKWKYLYNELFAHSLKQRQPTLPSDLYNLLSGADNLDQLFDTVTESAVEYLDTYATLINNKEINNKIKKRECAGFCRRIGMSVPAALMKDEEKNALKEQRSRTASEMPFMIHPMLIVKFFYENKYVTQAKGDERTSNDIFINCRRLENIKSLYQGHYDTSFIQKILPLNSAEDKTTAKLRHQWVRVLNDTLTEDALLWQIVLRYLDANTYTRAIADQLKGAKNGELHVGNLHGSDIIVRCGDVNINMKMHQLDDLMFATDSKDLDALAQHYLRRYKDEAEHWDLQVGPQQPIPYEVLRRERQMISHHAQLLAQYILDWERDLLFRYTGGSDNVARQKKLMDRYHETRNNLDASAHLNFKQILSLATELDISIPERLNDYRVYVFHDDIPDYYTFSYWVRPDGEAGKILGITEPLKLRKNKREYELSTGNGN